MKQISILLLAILLSHAGFGQICHPQLITATEDGECNNEPYFLVFEDNFDGDSLDLSKWQIQPWGQGSLTGDNTQQYYSLDNVFLSAGICSIIAKKDTVIRRAVSWIDDTVMLSDNLPNLRTYYNTSANIWTNQQFGYGIYEIRCKIPHGKGFWPAFWMYDSDSSVNKEIDVFEFWDDNTTEHQMTVHYNGMMCGASYTGPDYASAFHTYKLIWDEYKMEWYVDGVLKRKLAKYHNMIGQKLECDEVHENSNYILEKTFPTESLNIIANLAIQAGTYAPDTNTPFPASFEIDYIRYYAQPLETGIEGSLPQTDGNSIINIFPNPGNGILFLELKGESLENYEISLMDLQGETVYQNSSPKERKIRIDFREFARGIYVLHVHDNKTKNELARKVIFL